MTYSQIINYMDSPYQQYCSSYSSSGVSIDCQSGSSVPAVLLPLSVMRPRQCSHPKPQEGCVDLTPKPGKLSLQTRKDHNSQGNYTCYRKQTTKTILVFIQLKSLSFLSWDFALILQFCNINCSRLFPPSPSPQSTGDANNMNLYQWLFISNAES